MLRWILVELKYLICGKELRALERYRQACALAYRWNGQLPLSAETSQWIGEVGEGKRPADICEFRESLRHGRPHSFSGPVDGA